LQKLIIRYEKPDEAHTALHHLAAAIIAFRKAGFPDKDEASI